MTFSVRAVKRAITMMSLMLVLSFLAVCFVPQTTSEAQSRNCQWVEMNGQLVQVCNNAPLQYTYYPEPVYNSPVVFTEPVVTTTPVIQEQPATVAKSADPISPPELNDTETVETLDDLVDDGQPAPVTPAPVQPAAPKSYGSNGGGSYSTVYSSAPVRYYSTSSYGSNGGSGYTVYRSSPSSYSASYGSNGGSTYTTIRSTPRQVVYSSQPVTYTTSTYGCDNCNQSAQVTTTSSNSFYNSSYGGPLRLGVSRISRFFGAIRANRATRVASRNARRANIRSALWR